MNLNWRLIFMLSLFGLAMGIATVYWIPSNVEPFFWLVIFIISAYIIARQAPGKYFLHGLMTSIVNSVWIIAAHMLLFDQYNINHPEEIAMSADLGDPQMLMLPFGLMIGVVSGLVLGLFAFVASKLMKKGKADAAAGA